MKSASQELIYTISETVELSAEVKIMKREEAIVLLARILASCRPSNVTLVSLEHPDPQTGGDSEGYEVRFKWSVDDESFNIIKEIVTKQNLRFKDCDGCLVIYTPNRMLDKLATC